MKDYGSKLEEDVNLLKPGAKSTGRPIIAQFRPNPTLSTSLSGVFLFIGLTKLEKANGMFSFLQKPEDSSIPQNEWSEEEVVIEPGEGVIWRGDCIRKSGEGHGGVMLAVKYE